MQIDFFKYQGAGNDFVVLDNMGGSFNGMKPEHVASLCDRRFGIGADGLLLLSKSVAPFAFRMEYYNQDGSRASFCGNGARCICAFAVFRGVVRAGSEFSFVADDGEHKATVSEAMDWVDLQMIPVESVKKESDGAFVLNTGVPHYVQFVDDLENLDIMKVAPSIRYSELYKPNGVNVNFAHIISDNHIAIRTYERGVEAETLACGTGITAASIASSFLTGSESFKVDAKGGGLAVSFCRNEDGSFSDVCLSGPAKRVFGGLIDLEL